MLASIAVAKKSSCAACWSAFSQELCCRKHRAKPTFGPPRSSAWQFGRTWIFRFLPRRYIPVGFGIELIARRETNTNDAWLLFFSLDVQQRRNIKMVRPATNGVARITRYNLL